jgi:hypothetical protein
MTCIVGLVDRGIVWMGGDSASTGGTDQTIYVNPKVFFVGPFLIGISGSWRLASVLRFSFKPPKRKKGQSRLEYLSSDFIDKLRRVAREKGILQTDDGEDKGEEKGNPFLIGYDGGLFGIDESFAAYEPLKNYHAIGCGDNPALGSLYSSRFLGAKERILEALAASEQFCSAVRPPFVVLHT